VALVIWEWFRKSPTIDVCMLKGSDTKAIEVKLIQVKRTATAKE
jgi:hypothetical protein